jgi:hypothetical protein
MLVLLSLSRRRRGRLAEHQRPTWNRKAAKSIASRRRYSAPQVVVGAYAAHHHITRSNRGTAGSR